MGSENRYSNSRDLNPPPAQLPYSNQGGGATYPQFASQQQPSYAQWSEQQWGSYANNTGTSSQIPPIQSYSESPYRSLPDAATSRSELYGTPTSQSSPGVDGSRTPSIASVPNYNTTERDSRDLDIGGGGRTIMNPDSRPTSHSIGYGVMREQGQRSMSQNTSHQRRSSDHQLPQQLQPYAYGYPANGQLQAQQQQSSRPKREQERPDVDVNQVYEMTAAQHLYAASPTPSSSHSAPQPSTSTPTAVGFASPYYRQSPAQSASIISHTPRQAPPTWGSSSQFSIEQRVQSPQLQEQNLTRPAPEAASHQSRRPTPKPSPALPHQRSPALARAQAIPSQSVSQSSPQPPRQQISHPPLQTVPQPVSQTVSQVRDQVPPLAQTKPAPTAPERISTPQAKKLSSPLIQTRPPNVDRPPSRAPSSQSHRSKEKPRPHLYLPTLITTTTQRASDPSGSTASTQSASAPAHSTVPTHSSHKPSLVQTSAAQQSPTLSAPSPIRPIQAPSGLHASQALPQTVSPQAVMPRPSYRPTYQETVSPMVLMHNRGLAERDINTNASDDINDVKGPSAQAAGQSSVGEQKRSLGLDGSGSSDPVSATDLMVIQPALEPRLDAAATKEQPSIPTSMTDKEPQTASETPIRHVSPSIANANIAPNLDNVPPPLNSNPQTPISTTSIPAPRIQQKANEQVGLQISPSHSGISATQVPAQSSGQDPATLEKKKRGRPRKDPNAPPKPRKPRIRKPKVPKDQVPAPGTPISGSVQDFAPATSASIQPISLQSAVHISAQLYPSQTPDSILHSPPTSMAEQASAHQQSPVTSYPQTPTPTASVLATPTMLPPALPPPYGGPVDPAAVEAYIRDFIDNVRRFEQSSPHVFTSIMEKVRQETIAPAQASPQTPQSQLTPSPAPAATRPINSPVQNPVAQKFQAPRSEMLSAISTAPNGTTYLSQSVPGPKPPPSKPHPASVVPPKGGVRQRFGPPPTPSPGPPATQPINVSQQPRGGHLVANYRSTYSISPHSGPFRPTPTSESTIEINKRIDERAEKDPEVMKLLRVFMDGKAKDEHVTAMQKLREEIGDQVSPHAASAQKNSGQQTREQPSTPPLSHRLLSPPHPPSAQVSATHQLLSPPSTPLNRSQQILPASSHSALGRTQQTHSAPPQPDTRPLGERMAIDQQMVYAWVMTEYLQSTVQPPIRFLDLLRFLGPAKDYDHLCEMIEERSVGLNRIYFANHLLTILDPKSLHRYRKAFGDARKYCENTPEAKWVLELLLEEEEKEKRSKMAMPVQSAIPSRSGPLQGLDNGRRQSSTASTVSQSPLQQAPANVTASTDRNRVRGRPRIHPSPPPESTQDLSNPGQAAATLQSRLQAAAARITAPQQQPPPAPPFGSFSPSRKGRNRLQYTSSKPSTTEANEKKSFIVVLKYTPKKQQMRNVANFNDIPSTLEAALLGVDTDPSTPNRTLEDAILSLGEEPSTGLTPAFALPDSPSDDTPWPHRQVLDKVPYQLVSKEAAVRRTEYSSKEIARFLMIVAERHDGPEPALNTHLSVLTKSLDRRVDLATVRWDLLDPSPGSVDDDGEMYGDDGEMYGDDEGDGNTVTGEDGATVASRPRRQTRRRNFNKAMAGIVEVPSSAPRGSSSRNSPRPSSGLRNVSYPTNGGFAVAIPRARIFDTNGSTPAANAKRRRVNDGAQGQPRSAPGDPNPSKPAIFKKFVCRWKTSGKICDRTLHNFEALQRHVLKRHRKFLEEHKAFPCHWNECLQQMSLAELRGMAQFKREDPSVPDFYIVKEEDGWREHVCKQHLKPIRDKLGLGPPAVASDSESALSDVDYLSDRTGKQITPHTKPAPPSFQHTPPAGFRVDRAFRVGHDMIKPRKQHVKQVPVVDKTGEAYKAAKEKARKLGAGMNSERDPTKNLKENCDMESMLVQRRRVVQRGWPYVKGNDEGPKGEYGEKTKGKRPAP